MGILGSILSLRVGPTINSSKTPEGTLVDDCRTKRVKIAEVRFFDALPVEILSIIDEWINSFGYNYKSIAIVNRIESHKNYVFLNSHIQN